MTYYFSRGKKNKAGGTVKYKIGKETIKSTQVDKLREDGLLIKSSESVNSVTYKIVFNDDDVIITELGEVFSHYEAKKNNQKSVKLATPQQAKAQPLKVGLSFWRETELSAQGIRKVKTARECNRSNYGGNAPIRFSLNDHRMDYPVSIDIDSVHSHSHGLAQAEHLIWVEIVNLRSDAIMI